MSQPTAPTPPPGDSDGDAAHAWDIDDEPSAGPAAQAASPNQATPAATPAPAPPILAEPAEPAPQPTPGPAPGAARATTTGEKAALAVLGLVLLLSAAWLVRMVAVHVPTYDSAAQAASFPLAGGHATLADVQTYWREPVTSGPQADRFRPGVLMLPCAQLTLAPRQGAGALRVFFHDSEGQIVGDPTTLAIRDGAFIANGSPSITITATDGFRDHGQHTAYLAKQIDAWHLSIREAPTAEAPASQFTPLLEIPISPERR